MLTDKIIKGKHMLHPFELPTVNTGSDLINLFYYVEEHLKNNSAQVKIDGINIPIRIKSTTDKLEFVIDRGTCKPLDLQGVTSENIEKRFGTDKDINIYGKILLDIFNQGLPSIKKELQILGLIDDNDLVLNIEFVMGQTNVLKYNHNFIVIHNILKYIPVKKRRDKIEVNYYKDILQILITKLNIFSKPKGFIITHEFNTIFRGQVLDRSILNETLTFKSDNIYVTDTLFHWLHQIKVPKNVKVKLLDGTITDAISKKIMNTLISNNYNLDEVSESYYHNEILSGFIIYYTTMKLGDSILNMLTSELGLLTNHEGIVLRDTKYIQTFKITGSFILKGTSSKFRI